MTDQHHFSRFSTFLCLLGICLSAAGCVDPRMIEKKLEKTSTDLKDAPGKPPENHVDAAPAPVPFPTDNTQLVDKKAILAENPKLIEVENRINATDPLSGTTQSYFNIGSRVELLNMKHSIDLYKAENNRNPTFAEFDALQRQAGVKLKGIHRWQVYAYDDSTGELCILEDHEYKVREYEKAGLKLE